MKKLPLFYKIYLISTVSLVALLFIGLGVFWGWLDSYEKSTPQYVANDFCLSLADKNYDRVAEYTKGLFSKLEGKKELEGYFNSTLGGKSLRAVKKSTGSSAKSPCYVLMADDKAFMNITLSQNQGSDKWVISAVGGIRYGCEKVSVYMPDGAKLYANGIEMTGDNTSFTQEVPEGFDGLPADMRKPVMVKAESLHFLSQPEITAFLGDTPATIYKTGEAEYVVSAESGDALRTAHENMVFELSKAYSTYISNDKGFATLSPYLVRGSVIYSRLRTMDVMFFTPHDSYQFKDMKSDRYIKYSDDAFSCQISFNYVLYRGSKAFEYPTNYTFYFVRQDGKFKLAELSMV